MAEDNDNKTFRVRRARKWYFWFWVAASLMIALVYLFFLFPGAAIGPQQPIYFSHRVHAGVKQINCRFCHPYVARGIHAGLPPVEKCFYCHQYIIPTHPQIVKEKNHLDTKTPVPWIQIYSIPDFVKFKHQPHIAIGKIDCTRCHGQVATMDRLVSVQFKMGFCIDCHHERNAQTDCWLACHQ